MSDETVKKLRESLLDRWADIDPDDAALLSLVLDEIEAGRAWFGGYIADPRADVAYEDACAALDRAVEKATDGE